MRLPPFWYRPSCSVPLAIVDSGGLLLAVTTSPMWKIVPQWWSPFSRSTNTLNVNGASIFGISDPRSMKSPSAPVAGKVFAPMVPAAVRAPHVVDGRVANANSRIWNVVSSCHCCVSSG